MTYSPDEPQERRPEESSPVPSRRFALDSDEWIAILVAFGVIGTIFFWGLRPQANGGGGWLSGSGFSLLDPADDGPSGGFAPETGDAEAAVDPGEGGFGMEGGGTGLTPSETLRATLAGEDGAGDGALTLPARRPAALAGGTLAGGTVVGGAVAGGLAADGSTAATAEPDGAVAPAVEAAADPAEAPPLVASEDLETGVPQVAAGSWVAPFAASLNEAGRLGELPVTQGEFDVDAPITRAEFASLINQAEQAGGSPAAAASEFADIEASFWGAEGIAGARAAGFMSGYSTPGGLVFRPGEQIPRWQVFVTLASGLQLTPPADIDGVLSGYDTQGVPDWAKAQVAATIDAGLAINADRSKGLEAGRPTTRGEATAMLQQVLERQGKAGRVDASEFVIQAQ